VIRVVLQAKGKFVNRPTSTGGKKYDKFFVYIPTDLARDSHFPLHHGDEVEIIVRAKGRIEILKSKSG